MLNHRVESTCQFCSTVLGVNFMHEPGLGIILSANLALIYVEIKQIEEEDKCH